MGFLAAFAGGAAKGVQGHWSDVREKVADEAKRNFQERLADKQYKRVREDQLDDYKTRRIDAGSDRDESREYETEAAEAARVAALEDYEDKKGIDAKYAKPEAMKLGEKFVDTPSGPMKVKFNLRTGEQVGSPIPAYKSSSTSAQYGSYKPDLSGFVDPIDPTGDAKIPNVQIDRTSGLIVDPNGYLLERVKTDGEISAEVEAEVARRKDGFAWTNKKDKDAFGDGVTEKQFRQTYKNQLLEQAPTRAGEMGIDPNRIVSSVSEIGRLMSGANQNVGQGYGESVSQSPKNQGGLVFDQGDLMVDESGGQASDPQPATNDGLMLNNPGPQAGPAANAPQQKPPQPKLTDDEQKAYDELVAAKMPKQENPELNKPMRNPYAGSDVMGTLSRFARDNAPVMSAAGDTVMGGITGQLEDTANAYGGLLSRAGNAIADKHRDMVASGERMRENDKKRMHSQLVNDFFSGKPSIDAAKVVIESGSTSQRQKTAAQAYLKLQGEM